MANGSVEPSASEIDAAAEQIARAVFAEVTRMILAPRPNAFWSHLIPTMVTVGDRVLDEARTKFQGKLN